MVFDSKGNETEVSGEIDANDATSTEGDTDATTEVEDGSDT